MQQLTKEQAERCAAALGWIYINMTPHCDPIIPYWHVPEEQGPNVTDALLSLYPYFWFPRLVEKLRDEFARTGITPVSLHEAVGVPSIWLDYMDGTIKLPECLMRICAAVEALEKEKKT